MLNVLAEQIVSGLRRKAITTCSKWAETYRVMGQPFPGLWRFDHHPWTREMHDCQEELIIGQKAAQMGYTETALNKVFYAIDVQGKSVLYVLPATNPDASDFSSSRFDPALEESEHLRKIFSDVQNVGHKRAGNANLFIRGSRSRSQMKSLPVGMMIFDEMDEMVQENVRLAIERMSGQVEKQAFMLSTATIDNYGINGEFKKSSQDHFFFNCPHCSKLTELIFPDCMVIIGDDPSHPSIKDSHLICKECKHVLDHAGKIDWLKNGKWVAGKKECMSRGFYINQLYSMTVRPWEIAESYLRARTNPADEQEFYNSKMGVPHLVDGARITQEHVDSAIGGFKQIEKYTGNKLVTMGVDVGKWLHYEICEWSITEDSSNDVNLKAKCKVLKADKVLNFEELDGLMSSYRIMSCVIDANPERRKALEFAQRFWGYVKMCFYGNGVTGKTVHVHAEDQHSITVDRTSWLDVSLGRYKREAIRLPMDISTEYKDHMQALVRVYEKDGNGNPTGRYVNGHEADHFAHARNYCEIALQLGASAGGSQSITGDIL